MIRETKVDKKKMLKSFWKKTREDDFLVCEPYGEEDLKSVETKLGYRIPESYRALMATRNGGALKSAFFPKKDPQGKVVKVFRCDHLLGIADNDRSCLLGKYHNQKRQGGKILGSYDFAMSGFEIGGWSPDGGWGNTYVYLDYSTCGMEGEPRVCAYEMKWSPEHRQARPGDHVLAGSFSEFIEGLIAKPKVEPFDFDALEAKLVEGSKETIHTLIKEHPVEKIDAFGLYTDDGGFVSTSINTVRIEEPDRLYLTSEWSREGTNDAPVFSQLTSQLEDHLALLVSESEKRVFRNQLIDCCANALLKLKTAGFFATTLGHEIVLMVGTSNADMAQEKFKSIKKLLNAK